VSVEDAPEYIAGYTVANDVSVRDWQKRTSQYLQGKTFEKTTPVGPWMTTADRVDPVGLQITCTVDDEVVQDVSTSEMVFAPDSLVSYASQIITLMPGDLIITGTGAGVGAARKPPRFLEPGRRLKTTIAGLGTLENLCVLDQAGIAV
jgi:acylpyruvate hydrolase